MAKKVREKPTPTKPLKERKADLAELAHGPIALIFGEEIELEPPSSDLASTRYNDRSILEAILRIDPSSESSFLQFAAAYVESSFATHPDDSEKQRLVRAHNAYAVVCFVAEAIRSRNDESWMKIAHMAKAIGDSRIAVMERRAMVVRHVAMTMSEPIDDAHSSWPTLSNAPTTAEQIAQIWLGRAMVLLQDIKGYSKDFSKVDAKFVAELIASKKSATLVAAFMSVKAVAFGDGEHGSDDSTVRKVQKIFDQAIRTHDKQHGSYERKRGGQR